MTSAGSLHLLGSRLNLALLLEASKQDMVRLLGNPDKKKVIVWDNELIAPVGLIADVQFLRQLGVYKMVRLPVDDLTKSYPEADEYLFIIRPQLACVKEIIEAIRNSSKKQNKKFTVVFVPMKSQHCIAKLEESGLHHESKGPIEFYIDEFHMEMLPLDQDVISLDLNSAFTDMFIDNDPTPLFLAAKAICKIQAIYGIIPRIFGKGKNAKTVADLLERMRREMFSNLTSDREVPPQIDSIILLDRSVDLLTPLSTQLTYEGLIDEIYGVKHNVARFPRHTFSEEFQQTPKGGTPPSPQLPVMLNSDEAMFVEMRDLNFTAVGHFLSKEAKKITEAYKERHDAKTVSQLKQFVQKLPHMQQQKTSLSKHTTIAELIKHVTDKPSFLEQVYTEQQLREEESPDKVNDYIDKCIGMLEPIAKVLRLMCMQSVANNGLKPRLLDYYKRSILQAYGYEHLISLHHLEVAGLIKAQEGRVFPVLRKQLKLIPEVVDDKEPKDISYVFSGYAPLSVRLVELLEKPQGWGVFEEVTRVIPGPPAFARSQPVSRAQGKKKNPTVDRPLVVLVFFLGGCSYAEISALRFRSQMEGATTEYIVATTHITNGYSLVNSVLSNTPKFTPTQLWDNQLDDSAPSSAKDVGKATSGSRPRPR